MIAWLAAIIICIHICNDEFLFLCFSSSFSSSSPHMNGIPNDHNTKITSSIFSIIIFYAFRDRLTRNTSPFETSIIFNCQKGNYNFSNRFLFVTKSLIFQLLWFVFISNDPIKMFIRMRLFIDYLSISAVQWRTNRDDEKNTL